MLYDRVECFLEVNETRLTVSFINCHFFPHEAHPAKIAGMQERFFFQFQYAPIRQFLQYEKVNHSVELFPRFCSLNKMNLSACNFLEMLFHRFS